MLRLDLKGVLVAGYGTSNVDLSAPTIMLSSKTAIMYKTFITCTLTYQNVWYDKMLNGIIFTNNSHISRNVGGISYIFAFDKHAIYE